MGPEGEGNRILAIQALPLGVLAQQCAHPLPSSAPESKLTFQDSFPCALARPFPPNFLTLYQASWDGEGSLRSVLVSAQVRPP